MQTVVIVFTLLSYFVSAVVLLGSAMLGFVSTKQYKKLGFALAMFVLPPLVFIYAKVVIPILITTMIGYGIIVLGMSLRRQLFVLKDQLLEEIKKNLSKEEEAFDEETEK